MSHQYTRASGVRPITRIALMLPLLALAPTIVEAQRSYPVDFQVHAIKQSVTRHASATGTAPTTVSGTTDGIEASLIGESSGLGLFGRYLSSNITGPKVQSALEGGIAIGQKQFRLEIAYAERLYIPHDSTVRFLRGGFNSTTFLGTSGVAVRLRAGYYVPLAKVQGELKTGLDGWEGESALMYTWDRLPIFASAGYRINRLRATGLDEETSALTLGAGIWFWSR